MPIGYFTIEQWKSPEPDAQPQWVAVREFDADHTLTQVTQALEEMGEPGLFRVVQMQRLVWAEREPGGLRLRKWHATSPEMLARSAEAFVRDGGRWPTETVSPGRSGSAD